MKYVIFFDDSCPFCRHSVAQVYDWDRKHLFYFAPLTGRTARALLKERWEELKKENTLVFVENCNAKMPSFWIRGRAICRIFWLLGGWKKILGFFAFFPCGVDTIYAFIASRRHHLQSARLRDLPQDLEHFLD